MQDICAIRVRFQISRRAPELAFFNLGLDASAYGNLRADGSLAVSAILRIATKAGRHPAISRRSRLVFDSHKAVSGSVYNA
jgi:hypothetical protein